MDCVSVFNGSVSLPPTTRDFNLIPASYKDWFFSMFENGERKLPPATPGMAGVAQVIVQLIQSTDNFDIKELAEYVGDILFHNATLGLTKTKEKVYIGKVDYKLPTDVEVLFTPLENHPILVKIEDERVKFKALGGDDPKIDIACTDMMITNNVLFLKNKERLMELTFKSDGWEVGTLPKANYVPTGFCFTCR